MDEKIPESTDADYLARRFEDERARLHGVAYRVLGSAADADDAVQEAWLRLARSDASSVENLPAWLTTVVARVSLNILRSRRTRSEQPLETDPLGSASGPAASVPAGAVSAASVSAHPAFDGSVVDPEEEAVLADSVGLALLVVLDTLAPAERLAFVLHDLFDVPFGEIAGIVGRSPDATRQLASRARRRVRGSGESAEATSRALSTRRRVVDAYLTAIRSGDLEGLVRLLDPDVELRSDPAAMPSGRPVTLRGAEVVGRSAMGSAGRARFTGIALVDGDVGLVMAPGGKVALALAFEFTDAGLISMIDVIADPDRVRSLDIRVV